MTQAQASMYVMLTVSMMTGRRCMRRCDCIPGGDGLPSSEMMCTVLTELRIAASSCRMHAHHMGRDASVAS